MSWLSPADYQAIGLSLRVAVVATLISLPVGFLAAYAVTFGKFKGKRALEVLINLPLTLPPVVIGYFLLLLLGNHGWLGPALNWAGIKLLFTWTAAVIASAVVGFPLWIGRCGLAADPGVAGLGGNLGGCAVERHPAAFPAGHHCRIVAHVRPEHGRVRRHHPRGREHLRCDPDHSPGHL